MSDSKKVFLVDGYQAKPAPQSSQTRGLQARPSPPLSQAAPRPLPRTTSVIQKPKGH
jgi:hypothetical protein